MYDDVAASGVGKGVAAGTIAGGGALGSGLLPNTGLPVIELMAIALIAVGIGVALLRASKHRRVSADD
jgi:hypothetical protein